MQVLIAVGLAFNLASGHCGYMDTINISNLNEQYNKGVKNFIVGAGICLKYVDDWFKRFFPGLVWKDSKAGKKHNYGYTHSGGYSGALLSRGCLWAEVEFPTSNTTAKVLKIRMVDVGPTHEGPRFDVMGAFMAINDHRDAFTLHARPKGGGSLQKIDGTNLAFSFQDCHYDYVKGEIIGYGPEGLYKKFYPGSNQLFADAKSVCDWDNSYTAYYGNTIGGPKSPAPQSFAIVRVRFFIDQSAKEKAEKIIGTTIPTELMQVNYTESAIPQPPAQTNTQNAAPGTNSTSGVSSGSDNYPPLQYND